MLMVRRLKNSVTLKASFQFLLNMFAMLNPFCLKKQPCVVEPSVNSISAAASFSYKTPAKLSTILQTISAGSQMNLCPDTSIRQEL